MLTKRAILFAGVLFLSIRAAVAVESGFIDNPPQLLPDADRPGAEIWNKPGVGRAAYNKIMMEPVAIFVSPESKHKDLDAEELKTLSDRFHETLATTLAPEIALVNEAGPGVLYLRAAITDVKLANKKRGLLGYTPVGLVVTTAANAAGMRVSLQDAVLEVEILDSVTGERLSVLVDKAPKAPTEALSWDAVDETVKFYSGRLKSRMLAGK